MCNETKNALVLFSINIGIALVGSAACLFADDVSVSRTVFLLTLSTFGLGGIAGVGWGYNVGRAIASARAVAEAHRMAEEDRKRYTEECHKTHGAE